MRIIAFAGLAQSGKTTAAQMAAESAFNSGYSPMLANFAGPLKKACEMIGADKASNPDLYRKVCQFLGASLRDPKFVPGVTGCDYWTDQMDATLRQAEQDEGKRLDSKHPSGLFYETVVIIDDVRYMNEIATIRKWGGTTVFIDAFRRLDLPTDWEDLPQWRKDPSEEVAWWYTAGRHDDDLFDYGLVNNYDMDKLRDGIETMMPVWTGEMPSVQ